MWWLPWTRKRFQPCRSIRRANSRPESASYGDFQNPLLAAGTGLSNVYGQATFDRLVQILQQFLKGLALGCTAGNSWHLGPIAALLRLVYDNLDLHGSPSICGASIDATCVRPQDIAIIEECRT